MHVVLRVCRELGAVVSFWTSSSNCSLGRLKKFPYSCALVYAVVAIIIGSHAF
jgi:hypothetical protein